MKATPEFLHKPRTFWASVRSLSQQIGYSKNKEIVVPTLRQMVDAFKKLELSADALIADGQATPLANELLEYFAARKQALHQFAEPNLLSAEEARAEFLKLKAEFDPKCPIPMNKQTGDKRAEAYLTAMVNMLVEAYAGNHLCDYDPLKLATFTRDGLPIRTLARRVDGAFPSTVNPLALWEIKEYYYTTTFGSRVADGVYETLLDGTELQELRDNEQIDVRHYLIVDAHYTWWECGKSYLCRMHDMLHMGLVTEVLFGREVISEMPRIMSELRSIADARGS